MSKRELEVEPKPKWTLKYEVKNNEFDGRLWKFQSTGGGGDSCNLDHCFQCHKTSTVESTTHILYDPLLEKSFCTDECQELYYDSVKKRFQSISLNNNDNLTLSNNISSSSSLLLGNRFPSPPDLFEENTKIKQLKREKKEFKRLRTRKNANMMKKNIRIIEKRIDIHEKITLLIKKRYWIEQEQEEYFRNSGGMGGQIHDSRLEIINEQIGRLLHEDSLLPPYKEEKKKKENKLSRILDEKSEDEEESSTY
jgi:hypothetical protein